MRIINHILSDFIIRKLQAFPKSRIALDENGLPLDLTAGRPIVLFKPLDQNCYRSLLLHSCLVKVLTMMYTAAEHEVSVCVCFINYGGLYDACTG